MTTIDEAFEDVLDAIKWHEYGSQDERRAKALPALTLIRERMDELEGALNRIAAWSEGPTVNGGFDEPGSARLARAAISGLEAGTWRSYSMRLRAEIEALRLHPTEEERPKAVCVECGIVEHPHYHEEER